MAIVWPHNSLQQSSGAFRKHMGVVLGCWHPLCYGAIDMYEEVKICPAGFWYLVCVSPYGVLVYNQQWYFYPPGHLIIISSVVLQGTQGPFYSPCPFVSTTRNTSGVFTVG